LLGCIKELWGYTCITVFLKTPRVYTVEVAILYTVEVAILNTPLSKKIHDTASEMHYITKGYKVYSRCISLNMTSI